MRILIAYDGSECADEVLEDLSRAGFPTGTEAEILTVSETFMEPADINNNSASPGYSGIGAGVVKRMDRLEQKWIEDAEKIGKHAAQRVRHEFPAWRVSHRTVGGFPEYMIVEEAEKINPDLIVIGSHGRSAFGRAFFGSVSLKVLNDARCSVRVARRVPSRAHSDDAPLRILIAVDGSEGARQAFAELLRREWSADTSFRLLTVVEPLPYSVLLADMPKAEEARNQATAKLKEKGFHVSASVEFGLAKNVITREAEKWAADLIFIGAKPHDLLNRFLFGSVSYAVASRAHCTVEIIRRLITEDLPADASDGGGELRICEE